MKLNRISAVFAALAVSAMPLNAYAETEKISITPVYEYFNENDVNGSVVVEIPENVKADVSITIDTPELSAEPYYSVKELDGASAYEFLLEGRDKTDDDFRTYNLSIVVSGGEYGHVAEPYTLSLDIPDGNDHPDSFTAYSISFTVDDEITGKSWDISSETDTEKNIAVHLDSFLKGDVNGDAFVDSVDASLVLAEYSELSTGGTSSLTSKQKAEGDVNGDTFVDSVDASKILAYYADMSTTGSAKWE